MSTKDLTAKVRSLKELEALIAEAQAEAESIKDELIGRFTSLTIFSDFRHFCHSLDTL